MNLEVKLSSKQTRYEREAYNLLALIGDVGGFNGAVIAFPGFLMAIYSDRMFKRALQSEIPVKRKKKKQRVA